MTGPDDAEVTSVEGGDLRDPEALGGSDDRRVDRPEREIAVGSDELGHPEPVARGHMVDGEGAARKVAEEPDLRFDAESRRQQIRDLGDDEARDDERTEVGLEQLETRSVVSVVGVDVGIERACVDEQRGYRSASAPRISSMRSEMSLRPLRPVLAASSRRRPRPPTR